MARVNITPNVTRPPLSSSHASLVVCTRPREQNASWQKCLTGAGFDSIVQPLLDIRELNDSLNIQRIKNITLNLDRYQKIIFVSQNAVRFGLQPLEDYWPECPVGISWFAVGSKTAKTLKEGLQRRLNCFSEVNAAQDAMNSESLLAMSDLIHVKNEKILIARGLGGRPHLADVLTERGASVDLWELYERAIPEDLLKTYVELLLKHKDYDVTNIVFSIFSGETLDNFDLLLRDLLQSSAEFLGLDEEDYQHIMKRVKRIKNESWILVPGDRVNTMAENKGFRKIICSENASESSMVTALTNALKNIL